MSIITVAFFSGSVMRFTGSLTIAPIEKPMIAPTTSKTRRRFRFSVGMQALQHRPLQMLRKSDLQAILREWSKVRDAGNN